MKWNRFGRANVLMLMAVRLVAIAVGGVFVLGAGLIAPVERARACSLAGLHDGLLPYLLEESTVVAVGRLTDTDASEITLDVEEGLKGSQHGDKLRLNNRHFGLGPGCEVFVEATSGGYALPEEARVIAFLQEDLSGKSGVWMPSHHGYAIYEVGFDNQPFGGWSGEEEGIVRIDEHRKAFAAYEQVAFAPDLEKIGPCNEVRLIPRSAETLSRLSQAVAIAKVTGVDGMVATFETEEVLRGHPGATFTVNAHWFQRQPTSCDLEPAGGPVFEEGQRLLVLLFPDEFGIAQYRLANWGHGSLPLRGEWVSQGLPVLDDVRGLLASGVGTMPPPSNASRVRDGVLYPAFLEQIPGSRIDQAPQPAADGSVAPAERDDSGRWPDGRLLSISVGLLFAGLLLVLLARWAVPRR